MFETGGGAECSEEGTGRDQVHCKQLGSLQTLQEMMSFLRE